MDIIKAHKHSIRHYNELKESEFCGCFYCLKIFSFDKIADWILDGENKEGKTALCPYCGIDSVIGSASGFPITKDFLKSMSKHWF